MTGAFATFFGFFFACRPTVLNKEDVRLFPVPIVHRFVQLRPKDPNASRKKFACGLAGGGYVGMGRRVRQRCVRSVLEAASRAVSPTDRGAVQHQAVAGARQAIGAMS